MRSPKVWVLVAAAGLAWLVADTLAAQSPDEPSAYERIWGLTELYSNENAPYLQLLRVTGRFQLDYATVDADEGSASEWNVRRARAGLRAVVFQDLTINAELDLNPQERDPFYLRFTDLHVEWARSDAVVITVGKQGANFTLDGMTSSREVLAMDRNALSGNLWFSQEYMPGVVVSGTRDVWSYQIGAFSAGRANKELGEFNGSVFGLVTLGRDFSEPLGWDEATVTVAYVNQSPDADNTFTRPLRHVGSVSGRFDVGRWGVRGDLAVASGYFSQSDLRGAVAMPYVDLTDRLQLAGRLTLISSADPNGVSLPTYENRVVSGRGDRYREAYVGANYYFYGHRLKVQTGIQLAEMSDDAADGGAYSGFAWTTGLRVGW